MVMNKHACIPDMLYDHNVFFGHAISVFMIYWHSFNENLCCFFAASYEELINFQIAQCYFTPSDLEIRNTTSVLT